MKILALDLGDQWIGTALSDASLILARPHKTVTLAQLTNFLEDLFKQEEIDTVVVGYPQTLRGTESDQTKKIIVLKTQLEAQFTEQTWVFWDERLSSKHAQTLGKQGQKKDKLDVHSKAAAIILDAYMMHLRFKAENNISF